MHTMDKAFLYLELAGQIEQLARKGSLRAGARLPSIRDHARRLRVSISTVLQAYRTLEDRGVVEARPKSGFFVRAHRPPDEPAQTRPPAGPRLVSVQDVAASVLQAVGDPRYVCFGAPQAAREAYPNTRLRRAIHRQSSRHEGLLGEASAPQGAAALRQAISAHALSMGCRLAHDDIVVTHGCREAVNLCLRAVTRPGDIVAIESPAYFGFLQNLESLGLRAIEIPTHPRTGMSLDALTLALETHDVRAVVVVPTVSNPLGATMPLSAKRSLAALAAQHEVALVEDVICNDLAPTQESRRAVRSFDRSGQVMICGSFGKTLAPGLSVGWVDAGRWAHAVARLKFASSAPSPAILDLGLADMLQHGGYEQLLRRLRRGLAEQLACARRIVGESFPRGSRVTNPAAGLFLWIELPRGVDGVLLAQRCLEQGVVIVPGVLFTTAQRYRNCIRITVGQEWTAERMRALHAVGRLARDMLDAAD